MKSPSTSLFCYSQVESDLAGTNVIMTDLLRQWADYHCTCHHATQLSDRWHAIAMQHLCSSCMSADNLVRLALKLTRGTTWVVFSSLQSELSDTFYLGSFGWFGLSHGQHQNVCLQNARMPNKPIFTAPYQYTSWPLLCNTWLNTVP